MSKRPAVLVELQAAVDRAVAHRDVVGARAGEVLERGAELLAVDDSEVHPGAARANARLPGAGLDRRVGSGHSVNASTMGSRASLATSRSMSPMVSFQRRIEPHLDRRDRVEVVEVRQGGVGDRARVAEAGALPGLARERDVVEDVLLCLRAEAGDLADLFCLGCRL